MGKACLGQGVSYYHFGTEKYSGSIWSIGFWFAGVCGGARGAT